MKRHFTRRSFVKKTLQGLACLSIAPWLLARHSAVLAQTTPSSRLLVFISDTNSENFVRSFPEISPPSCIYALDVADQNIYKIDTPFFGHTMTQNPSKPHEFITFEKWGTRAALISTEEMRVTKTFTAQQDNVFYGHACYTNDGKYFVTTEDHYAKNEGKLIVRDSSSLVVSASFSSYGARPHECRLVDKDTLLVINSGNLETKCPNLTWIDLKSGILLDQVLLNFEPRLDLWNVDISPTGWIAISGEVTNQDYNKGSPRIFLVSPKRELIRLMVPQELNKKMAGTVLGMSFLGGSDYIAATVPYGNMLFVWNYKLQKLAYTLEMSQPGALLSLMGPQDTSTNFNLLVDSYKDKSVMNVTFSAMQDKLGAIAYVPPFGGNGSHLVSAFV